MFAMLMAPHPSQPETKLLPNYILVGSRAPECLLSSQRPTAYKLSAPNEGGGGPHLHLRVCVCVKGRRRLNYVGLL